MTDFRRNFYDSIVDRVRSTPIAPNPVQRAALHTLAKPWLAGLTSMLVGVLLVALAIPLGG